MKKIINKLAILTCCIALGSCTLDEYNPSAGDSSLSAFTAWSGLVANCYTPLYSQLFSATDYLAVAETGTDTWLVKQNGNNTMQLFYYENLTTSTNATNKLFKQCYSMIASCNSVINGATELVDGDAEDIKVLAAEAKCLRAYYYSVLVCHFGPVTLNLKDAGNVDQNPVRNTEAEIYAQIIKDLKEAATDLNVEPYGGNYARCSKKTALGLLARAYAQGAGLGLTENGISYWQKAKEVSEDLINNASSYGAYLYTDVADLWADANNRNNKEALFVAAGPRPGTGDAGYYYAEGSNKLFAYTCGNPGACSEFFNKNHKPSDKGYFYGRMNSSLYMPSKYLMDCFNPTWDKRWENTWTYAYSEWSMVQPGWIPYGKSHVTITQNMCDKYGINPAFVGEKLYPYADVNAVSTTDGNQYPASVWPKGDHSGNTANLLHPKKVYVVDYPIALDDDRFCIVLTKTPLTEAEKAQCKYFVINIDDLYQPDGQPYANAIPTIGNGQTNAHQCYPSLNKFNWSYKSVFNGRNLQIKYGDMFIMRMAEVYLIAAEAEQQLGNGAAAAKYLNVLRERAVRDGVDKSTVRLANATEEDIFDEYARELCGEFSRWALLKRHNAFETRLAQYNVRAAQSFKPLNYYRPISEDFLTQIKNREQYGDNGYGTTANSGIIH